MVYDITDTLNGVEFAPASEHKEIIQNLQNRAIAKEKVSSVCMPDYLEAYTHYCELAKQTGGKVSERIKMNHEIILEMVKNGQVVDTLREWYK